MASDKPFLHELVLATTRVQRSTRDQVDSAVIAHCRGLIEAGGGAIGGGDRLELEPLGRCVAAMVHRNDQWLATIGVAAHSRCGTRLWYRLHLGRNELPSWGSRVPPEPWCAVRLEEGAALHVDAKNWLGGFARAFAWAWLDARKDPSRLGPDAEGGTGNDS